MHHTCTMKKKPSTKRKTGKTKMAKGQLAATQTPALTSETQPAPPAPSAPATPENDEGVNPLTDEAFQWMIDRESIPGAFPPILYCGPSTLVEISEANGKPIELDEAKRLVQADGPEQTCSITPGGKKFQPVAYVPYCPKGLKKQIDEGATLLTARLPFGGQFYILNGSPKPVSGSVFHYDERTDSYQFASSSPLVTVAREFSRQRQGMKWGVTWGQVEKVLNKRKERGELRDAAKAFVLAFTDNKNQGLTSVEEAFDKAKQG